jgi:hypothetical protein
LPSNVTFAYSFNLPFSHHMHRLITPDCSTCRIKEEPEPGIDATFYKSVVLLDEVVEIFTLSQLSAIGEGSFFLQLLGRRQSRPQTARFCNRAGMDRSRDTLRNPKSKITARS